MADRMQERGFTLIELLITMSVLCFGLLGLAGLQVHMVRANGFNGNMTIATAIGTDLIEEAKSVVCKNLYLYDQMSPVEYGDMDGDGNMDLGDLDIDGDGSPDDPYNGRFEWRRSSVENVGLGYCTVNVSVFWDDSNGNPHQLDFATVVR